MFGGLGNLRTYVARSRRTDGDEFASTQPAFRRGQVVALARVTASEFGTKAPGYRGGVRVAEGEGVGPAVPAEEGLRALGGKAKAITYC